LSSAPLRPLRPRKSQILLSRFVLSRSGLKIRDHALRHLGPIFA
jgi:hypothetical protein